MSTFTREQMNAILQSVQNTGGKKVGDKIGKVLALSDKKFTTEKIVEMLAGSRRDGALKKPKNAWQLFLVDFREGDAIEPGMNGAEIVKMASPIWKKMTNDEKKPFEDEAGKLSLAYKEAKGKNSPKKNDSAEKRPSNAWMLFLADYRKDNAKPGVAGSAVAKEAGVVWREMSDEAKEPYEEKAKTLKNEYNDRKANKKDDKVKDDDKPKKIKKVAKTKDVVKEEVVEEKKEEDKPKKITKMKNVKEVAPPPPVEDISDEEEESDVEDSDEE